MILSSLLNHKDYLQIEPTTRCNLSCRTCTHKDGVPQIDLSPETLQYILTKHRHISTIKMQGLGEPFLHPQIRELFRIASSRCRRVTTTTNGTCVDLDAVRHLSEITVSLDTLDPEKACQIKGKSYDLDRVIGTILDLNGILPTRINFVYSMHTLNDLQSVTLFAKSIGVPLDVVQVENWLAPGEPGYEEAHKEILLHRGLTGPSPRWGERHCPFLHGRHFMYSADGERRVCCIRMKISQVGLTHCCDTCPD